MGGFQLPELPGNIVYGVTGVIFVITAIVKLSKGPNLDSIPTIGSGGWLGSWWAGFKFLTSAQTIIQQGYDKYKYAPFKVAEPNRWTVILSNPIHINELVKAPEEDLSFRDAINDHIQVEHVQGRAIHHHPYHVPVIRLRLTRNLEALYPQMRDEIVTCFSELLDLNGNVWNSVPALSLVEKIVCRTSNRVFVGLPLCRDPDWIDLNIQYITDAITGGFIVGPFPKFMRSLAARFLTRAPQSVKRGVKLLGPMIEERQKYLSEYGKEWEDKPNDLLSWLMDKAEGPESTIESLTRRILASNLVAVHTSANSFTQALLYLAASPQYVQPLREEIEDVIKKGGWTKAALGKMHKVDSFLKECQRMEGILTAPLSRKAVKDFTFSDGTTIPKGATVAVAAVSLHRDRNFYKNPDVFEPFRFVHTDEGEKGTRHHFTSTSTEYLAFGHGKHACPGRFFVAAELKSMLAHVIMTYDVKLEDEICPVSWHISSFIKANPRAKVMFRNRVD